MRVMAAKLNVLISLKAQRRIIKEKRDLEKEH
jgi:hypothetical protein